MTRGGATALLLAAVVAGCSGEIRFSGRDSGLPVDDGAPGGSDTGAAPPPDAASNGCDVDADCLVATLHCDVVIHECVPCVNDGHCADPTLPRCDTAAHECVECGVQSDCGPKQTCVAATHKCVGLCSATDKTCPASAPSCDASRGFCIGCATSADCTGEPVRTTCEVASGRCVQCTTDDECAGGVGRPRCDPSRGTCVQCASARDCPPSAPICLPGDHVCVAR